MRRLVEAVAMLDTDASGIDAIETLASRVDKMNKDISDLPSLTERGGAASAGGKDAVLFERSGISGRSNPLAPPLQIWTTTSRWVEPGTDRPTKGRPGASTAASWRPLSTTCWAAPRWPRATAVNCG
ncbi:MAG: hypothetical protein ACYCS7_14300 [Acidimicrobiales bacterium]